MSARLDHHEHFVQFLFRVRFYHPLEFAVHSFLRLRQHSKIQNSRENTLYEDEIAKISIAGHENTLLLSRYAEQFFIRPLRQSDPRDGRNLMS